MSNYQFITLDRAKGVARLALNRPPLNVLHIPMMQEMGAAMDDIASDASLKALVLEAGADCRAFSAGVDIADHTADKVSEMLMTFHHVFHVMAGLDIPIVALVDGVALGGGCEVLLFCDMVVATQDSKFGQPEIKVGSFAPIASLALERIVGPRAAAEMLLTGESIDAQEALRIGLVNRVVPADKLAEASAELLNSMLNLSGYVLRIARRAYRIGLQAEIVERLNELERLYLDELMQTHDAHEGVAAFMEKRPPVWADS